MREKQNESLLLHYRVTFRARQSGLTSITQATRKTMTPGESLLKKCKTEMKRHIGSGKKVSQPPTEEEEEEEEDGRMEEHHKEREK